MVECGRESVGEIAWERECGRERVGGRVCVCVCG